MEGGEEFGPWLGRQLARAGMSQADLAAKVGLTRAAVSAWITGRAVPREETMQAIAAALGADRATVHLRTTDIAGSITTGWYHRPAHEDGGREFGNAAAFAFDADVGVLAREATQNSLDERLDATRPVRVRYTIHELSGEHLTQFLDALKWDQLAPHYEAAAAQDQKVSKVLREGLRELRERSRLVLLRVDDYNATGLIGDDYDDGRFAAVVRRQLDSNKKSQGAGGSYGLGKATLWATSRLGLVLINSTLSEPHEGRTERRLIGRLDLPWHEADGKLYAGPAWFGEPDTARGNEIARSWWADEDTVEKLHITRENPEPGTSFLIVGAHDVAGKAEDSSHGDDLDSVESMHRRLVEALGQNFWAAMTAGGSRSPILEASVRTLRNGRVVLEEERVDPHAAQPSRSRALQAYLDGETVDRLTETGQVALARVPLRVPAKRNRAGGAAEHEAVILVTAADDNDGKPNQLVAMRGSRMVVRTSRVPDLPLGAIAFQAVLLAGHAAGDDVPGAQQAEEFLRASEPPEHNKWGPTDELRAVYVVGAQTRLTEFTRAANTAVRQLVGRAQEKKKDGPKVLRDLLKLDGGAGAPVPRGVAQTQPTIQSVDAELEPSGAWSITVEVKLPGGPDPVALMPVAKFDVRSGAKPTVGWSRLEAVKNCEVVEGGRLLFAGGERKACFTAVTDEATHPVRAQLAGLIVELQKAKGASS
ncbi:helix-turn-helix transcriptional regulator [Streptomyces sp. NPDC002734]|uniref:helix-turn-helix transcriptional regulator n=1 Tax=Streptomyces sp. NPDC002734 TaxID=3154426 RepID=UPI003329ED04